MTKYVYGRGLIGEETNGEFKTYHFDSRGSTVAITDEQGNITDTFAYDTYGKLISRTGTSDIIFQYNGRDGVVTEPNGLIYMRARYYSPELRRFINADIVAGEITNAITLNRYAYANANPVSFVDPLGLSVGSLKFVHAFSNDGASESKPKDSRGEDTYVQQDFFENILTNLPYYTKAFLDDFSTSKLFTVDGSYEHSVSIFPGTEIYCSATVSAGEGPITVNLGDYADFFKMDTVTEKLAQFGDIHAIGDEYVIPIYSDEYSSQYLKGKVELNQFTDVLTVSGSYNVDLIFESGSTVTFEQGIRQKIIKPNKRLAYAYAFAPAYNRDAMAALRGKYDFPGTIDYGMQNAEINETRGSQGLVFSEESVVSASLVVGSAIVGGIIGAFFAGCCGGEVKIKT